MAIRSRTARNNLQARRRRSHSKTWKRHVPPLADATGYHTTGTSTRCINIISRYPGTKQEARHRSTRGGFLQVPRELQQRRCECRLCTIGSREGCPPAVASGRRLYAAPRGRGGAAGGGRAGGREAAQLSPTALSSYERQRRGNWRCPVNPSSSTRRLK
ncbi:hypothetical protein K466DRAFT_32623 [Polyporus arcularius HHB13444]|uniref:Uncharacterized protein n=1 Tax=Polyporus arcularius HHB13444 TaxID=1314778 RepID=A0A5C3PJ43_9APHY|nr:hypothetical protein K466DRAFT_32623 [Polyporus arcularius HHB13444]